MPRTGEMKEAFYKRLVARLGEAPGLRPEDIFICLSDRLALEDISFANGISAAELAARYGRSR
jgi:hypothetical protein